MRALFKNTYGYFVTLPDRWYPFASKVGGRWVRGRRSYELVAARALKKRGLGRLGYKLILYRELFHFIGSVFVIVLATLLSKKIFGSDVTIYLLLYGAIVALTFQEFYVHPRHYGQRAGKGVLDWLVWVVPMVIYLLRF